LALIRSFLIDSGPSAPSRAVNCAKIFCCAYQRAVNATAANFGARACDFYARSALVNESEHRNKSLFHRSLCNVGNARMMYRQAFAQTEIRATSAQRARVSGRRMCTAYTFR
jgi:hypothetical protein